MPLLEHPSWPQPRRDQMRPSKQSLTIRQNLRGINPGFPNPLNNVSLSEVRLEKGQ